MKDDHRPVIAGAATNDIDVLLVIEAHLTDLWRVQRHSGNRSLLRVLKLAERKLESRQADQSRAVRESPA